MYLILRDLKYLAYFPSCMYSNSFACFFFFFYSMMVMFYVKGGSMAKDGQAVAEMLKAKIENEEGFFEFRMLKVEPYSK